MNRRSFLSKVSQGVLGLTALDCLEGQATAGRAAGRTEAKNWMWVLKGSENLKPDEQTRKFEQIREAGIHAVLLGSFNADVLARATEQGLETHSWILGLRQSEKQFMDEHPDWYAVNRLGQSTAKAPPYVEYYNFLCPSHEAVQDYLAKVVSDLGNLANLDGIHLDYIRYPDVKLPVGLWKKYNLVQNKELPQFDYCYCRVCRDAFKKQTGEDPLTLPDPTTNAAWRQFRYDSVTRLVNRLADVAHERGKKLTAAVFPTPSLARKLVRQDWVRWNLDAVLPMVYHNFYNEKPKWIERAVKDGVAALPPNRPLYAGLFLYALNSEEEFDQAVKYARAGGAKGVSLFGGLRKVKPG